MTELIRFSSILFFVTSLAFGCASSERGPEASLVGTLEVENATSHELVISVRGRAEAHVKSGERARVRFLPPGDALLEAHARDAGRPLVRASTLKLSGGTTTLWTVAPDENPVPLGAPFAALVVKNPSDRHVDILVDGTPRGRVFSGGERRFEDLLSGTIKLEARPVDGSPSVMVDLPLPADTDGQFGLWSYAPSGVSLEVKNDTDEALSFSIDGLERARIDVGETWRGIEPAGLKLLSARSQPSRRVYEQVLDVGQDGGQWEIRAGQAALVVRNRTREKITVEADVAPFAVDPGGEHRLEDLSAGSRMLKATGESGMVYAMNAELLAGQTLTWVVDAVEGSVRVDNRTRKKVTIYVSEGDLPERERGEVLPGRVAIVKELARGTVKIRAVETPTGLGAKYPTVDGGRSHSVQLDLAAQAAATWVITDVTGAVRVTNGRDETIEVFIDAMRVGLVPPGEQKTFTGVASGMRLVESVGTRSGAHEATPVAVPDDGLVSLEAKDLTAFVEVINGAGEVLEPQGLLAEQVTRIGISESARFRLRAGLQRIVMVGRDTGFSYGTAVELGRGETEQWTARLAPGRLVLWSRLAESVAVTVDDVAVGSLAPDEALTLDLEPRRHSLRTVGLRSGRVTHRELVIAPESEAKITLSMEDAVLVVENRAREPVSVVIDGELYGEVGGERLKAFGKIVPGVRDVVLQHVKSQRVQRIAVEAREGQRVRVVASAPTGLLVIENASRGEVGVRVDGVRIAKVAGDAGPTLVPVPAGSRHIQLERLGVYPGSGKKSGILGFELDIAADHAIHIPVPPVDVRLVIVNRSDERLVLFAGERRLGEIAPRSSEMLEHVEEGEVDLSARTAAGLETHVERRTLRAGETATWVLDATKAPMQD